MTFADEVTELENKFCECIPTKGINRDVVILALLNLSIKVLKAKSVINTKEAALNLIQIIKDIQKIEDGINEN